ncbi:cardiolipin synthase [uncultured Bacteroides sp.]|uniref:cardiolipin synthase n=1 Tax=uncultured Bacteroides sp. TaxID=162156 RepID=UPI00262F762F|nr:cardiolipin synthase [uncultured Bacteroides sp.]
MNPLYYKLLKTWLFSFLLIFAGSILANGPLYAENRNIPEKNDTTRRWMPADSVFANWLRSKNYQIVNNNEIQLLTSGREKFNVMFEEIRKAQSSIHLEYFNFRNDSIAGALFDLLGDKVHDGVKVRAIYDAFGNMSNNRPLRKKHVKALHDEGIEIVIFDPFTFPYINHAFSRDHQKIVVIDGKVGYTGGMNVADYYINGLPEIGPWRDMHVRFKGPIVAKLQEAFLKTWNDETHQHIDGNELFPYSQDSLNAPPTHAGGQVAIVQRIPHKAPKAMREAYIAAINSAQQKIEIINPYFTPIRCIRRALEDAIKRGVRVEIMIPGKSDIPFTPDAAMYIVNKLRKKGAHIYIYNGGFHHSKIMMVDDRFCTVGSTNLNSRSLRYDYEINSFIFDLKTTDELTQMFKQDKLNSTVLTKEVYKKRSVFKRLWGWFAHLFVPVI